MFTPACMDAAEFELWQRANRDTHHPAQRPCFDCPLWFAAEMRAMDCCNGEPGENGPRHRTIVQHQGRAYATEEERRAARRQSWRESARRRRCASS